MAEGRINYEYVIAVFEAGDGAPFLLVTSERNASVHRADNGAGAACDGGSHFFCYFDAAGHHNLGDSDRWSDAYSFEAEALRWLRQRLGATPEAE